MKSQQNCLVTACRRGAVSAMVIVVLLILLGMLVAHVRLTLNERRQMQNELQYQQTLELAKAGVLLVKSHQDDPAWTGMRWEVGAGQIHQTNHGVVEITVRPDRTWKVTARYPLNAAYPFQVTQSGKLSP